MHWSTREYDVAGQSIATSVGPENGPPLVFVHGVTRSGEDFREFATRFANQWQPWLVDLRGHGRSAPSSRGRYTIPDYAADVRGLVESHAGPGAVVVGHSLGSLVALELANSPAVRALALEDPPCALLGTRIRTSRFRPMFECYRAWLHEGVDEAQLASRLATLLVPVGEAMVPLGRLRDPQSLRVQAAMLCRVDPAVFAPLLDVQWPSIDRVAAQLRGCRAPVLVAQGSAELGGMCDTADAIALRGLNPQGTTGVQECEHPIAWHSFAEAGHLIHQQRPDDFAAVLAPWLAAVRLPGRGRS